MLNHIRTNSCAACGAGIVGEELETHDGQIRQHVNGQRWELRKFACGHTVKWIPNFSREETAAKCPHEQNEVEKRSRREAAAAALSTRLDELDVDAEFRKSFSAAIKRIVVHDHHW